MIVFDRRLVTVAALIVAFVLTLAVAILAITVRNLDRRLTPQLARVEERLQTETMERTAGQDDVAEHLRILEQTLTTRPTVQKPKPAAVRHPLATRLKQRFRRKDSK